MGGNINNCFLLALICGLVSGGISYGMMVLSGSIVASMATNLILYLVTSLSSVKLMELWDPKALKDQVKVGVTKEIAPHLRPVVMESFFMFGMLMLMLTSVAILFWTIA